MFEFEILAEKTFYTEPPVDGGMPGQWYILCYSRTTDKKETRLSLTLIVKKPESQHGTVTHYCIDNAPAQPPEVKPTAFLDDLLDRLLKKEVHLVPTDKQFYLELRKS